MSHVRSYSGYKSGMNSKNMPSGMFDSKYELQTSPTLKEMEQYCEVATNKIQQLIAAGEKGLSGLPNPIKATRRQCSKFRNKSGVAYKYGRG